MSEENNTGTAEANGQGDIEKLQLKNGEVIAKNKVLKEENSSLMGEVQKLKQGLQDLGSYVGVAEGEDIGLKAKEMLEAKEKEAFDKLSDIDKLNLRMETLEGERNEARNQAEIKTKEALGLRIDEKIKTELTKAGVSDPNNVGLGLDVLKVRNSIQGMEGDNLVLGDGSNVGVGDLVSGFLESNKGLISNPASRGSGFTGGRPVNTEALSQKEALENARKTGKYTNVISQQLADLQGN